MLKTLLNLFTNDLSIDLGTANTLIYARDHGIVLNEPSVVAIRNVHGNETVEAVGDAAKVMLGRTPLNIKAIRPLKDGVIADFKVTEKMLQYFIKKVQETSFFSFSPRVLVCVPCVSTQVERRAIIESAMSAGARKVMLLEEPVAAALGAGLDIDKASGSMVVDIGGGTTEIAVLSLGGVVCSTSVRIGGDRFDECIVNYIRQKYSSIIGIVTAEKIKQTIGCAHADYTEQKSNKETGLTEHSNTYTIKVRNLSKGIPQELKLTSAMILEAIKQPLETITDVVKEILEKTEPELITDIAEKGIVLTGGGALLSGIDKLISESSGLAVVIADEPLNCVARGGGIALESMEHNMKTGLYIYE